MVIGRLIIF
jgi:hypothetical protein